MRKVYNISFLTILLSLSAFVQQATADVGPNKDFVKTIAKEFPLPAKGEVRIDNKHGRVDIKTWDKQAVRFDITLTVKAGDAESAERAFGRIAINFDNGASYAAAKTLIQSQSGRSAWSFWPSWFSSVWSGSDKVELKIDYSVSMPKAASLDLDLEYGDAAMPQMLGAVSADIRYGNLRIDGAAGFLRLAMAYSDGSVGSAGNGNYDLAYSNLDMGACKNANFTAQYSNVSLEEGAELLASAKYANFDIARAVYLKADGKYDTYKVGAVRQLVVDGSYSDINIGSLLERSDITARYGSVLIRSLESSFKEVAVDGSYADIKIYVSPDAKFKLAASAGYADVRYPEGLRIASDKRRSNSHEVEGNFGAGAPSSSINVQSNYGGIKIMLK
jgi:hypothetical protein